MRYWILIGTFIALFLLFLLYIQPSSGSTAMLKITPMVTPTPSLIECKINDGVAYTKTQQDCMNLQEAISSNAQASSVPTYRGKTLPPCPAVGFHMPCFYLP